MNNEFLTSHFEFTDFDECAASINLGDLQHAQLDAGDFKAQFQQATNGKVIVSAHRMNRTILQQGSGNPDYTHFLMPGILNQDFSWRNHRLKSNRIAIVRKGMEHTCVTLPNFFAVPISIRNDYLTEIINNAAYGELFQLIQKKEIVDIDPEIALKIQTNALALLASKIENPNAILDDIASLVLEAISTSVERSEKPKFQERNQIFKKATAYISSKITQPLSVLEIGMAVGTTDRNLRYIFHEQTGLSPKQYIQNLRLNEVRKALKINTNGLNIIDISSQWGFWHSGQFAADYKKLFGELPSETYRIGDLK